MPETDGAKHINTHNGAVVFIHRFGGLLNAHLHFHVLMIDGVFCEEEAGHLLRKRAPNRWRTCNERSANASSAFSYGSDCWTRPKTMP